MKKKFKKAVAVILTMAMTMSVGVPAFAAVDEENVSPQADTVHYYKMKNKEWIKEERFLEGYEIESWAITDHYTIEDGTSYTIGLSVSPLNGTFPLSAIRSLDLFTLSYTKTHSVSRTIPADTRYESRLAIYGDYDIYQGDLYYVTDYGYTTSEIYKGSGEVAEPIDVHIIVEYNYDEK